jgi:hypothetical protein
MGKYRIHASYVVTLFLDIDAENIDDAWSKAKVADGANFIPVDESCWNIDEVSLLYGEIK